MNNVNISMDASLLAKLIHKGELCAADFKCLDKHTKKAVWQMCLIHCQQRIHCNENLTQMHNSLSYETVLDLK